MPALAYSVSLKSIDAIFGARGFTPSALFSSGEQGAWYDPSDFSTMFQDSAGTTPVTAVEQPVGLLLDKSKGLALGAELVTNGDFSSNTWWSTGGGAAISGGALNFTAAVATSGAYRLGFATVGKYYELTFEIISISSGGIQITLGTSSGTNRTAAGVYTQRILCTGNGNLTLYSVGASTTASVDNVSIKEVQGNHASQSTAASRPVLSARVNLLTYSEQFDNAAWTKQNSAISANAETAPNGTLTADKFTPTAAASVDHRLITGVITTTGGYTLALYVKPAGYSKFGFRNGAVGEHATFNLSGAGAVIEQNDCTATITAEADGWYKVQIVDTSASIRCDFWALDDAYTSGSPGAYSYAGDGTSGIYIWGADLRVTNAGVGLPAYQRVGAAVSATTNPAVTGVPDYDTSGFPLYLKFDGVDDSLATGTIDFSSTDKMSVFAGVRKLSDAAQGELANINGVDIVSLSVPRSASITGASAIMGSAENRGSTVTAPATLVLAAAYDRAALTLDGQVALRSNTVSSSASGTITASGVFGNRVIYIGRRGGSTLPLNAYLFSLIVRGALSTDAQIASTETYVNSKTGAY